ncbi:MAG: 30S ribosomal protein S2 [Bacilli bacterium]|nr:30S ribosomal protein S2 [Bacilli bacterium]
MSENENKVVEEVQQAETEAVSVMHDETERVVSTKALLEVGAHFGHLTRRWEPKFKPFIYGIRSGVHIINIDKTTDEIQKAYFALRDIVAKGGKVLFVGTKKAASEIIVEEAIRSGSFYVARRWLGGSLTNFKTISKRTSLLKSLEQLEIDGAYENMPKKVAGDKKKLQAKLAANLEGIKEMRKIPDAMVVVDPKAEHNAVAEAKILNIPVFALLGSNCNPQSVTFPIPCNDDSSKTIKLILGLLADAVVEGKGGDVAYAYQHVEGDEAKMSEILKGVDKTEELKSIRSRIKEDQYALRAAKKGKKVVRNFHKKDVKKVAKEAPKAEEAPKEEEVNEAPVSEVKGAE